MMIGNLLIYGGVVTSAGSTAALAWAATRDESIAAYGRYLLYATAGLFVAAYGLLTYQFATLDYANKYVWEYTADYISLFYRVTGTYAGVNGSLLLWAALVAVFVAWLGREARDREHALVAAIGAAVMTVFALMAVNRTPFTPFSFEGAAQIFGPQGLLPLLLNPYMGIHPPITFVGYALTVPPFAIAAAHFYRRLRGREGLYKRWLPRTMSWLRLSWLFLTGAVALGALWSYNTLGWGGLWAWDPVETAVLVSWLVVSMAVHAVANYRRRGQNRLLAPAMTAITLPGVLFARFITQSGTSPLHSFGVKFSTLLVGLMIVSFLIAVVPALVFWLRAGEEVGRDLDDHILTLGNLLYLSVLIIGVLTFISVWGIGLPAVGKLVAGTEMDIGVNFYNLWSYPVAVAMLLLLGLYNDYVANGRDCLRMFYGVIAITLLVAVIPLEGWQIAPDASGLLYGILGQVNALVLFPPVAYVFLGVTDRLMTVIPRLQSRDEQIALTGRGLVHVGLALIILAAPFTYLFAASGAGMVPVGSTGMGAVTLGDSQYAVSLENYRSVEQPTVADLSEAQQQALMDEVDAASIAASQVQGQNLGSAFVYGEITDFRRNSQSVSLQLSGSNVWVPVGAVQSPQNFVGRTLYLQGRVQSDASGETTVQYRTIGQFPMVGFAPLDAVVPPHRFTRHQATVQVYKNGNQIANGQAGLRNNALYGSVSEIYIKHGLLKDTYVAPQQVQTLQSGTPAMYVSVKEVPLMNGVRLGIAVMLIGGFLIWRFDRGEAEDWD